MQEQIRPHFFLNCLSLIHGIADAQGEEKITHITRVLSEYIRYNYRDSGKERNLQEELEHVRSMWSCRNCDMVKMPFILR